MQVERALDGEVAAVRVLRAALAEMDMDEEAISLSIESETSFPEAVSAVMAAMRDDEILVHGIGHAVAELDVRQKRIQDRIKRRRQAIERAMLAADVHRLELPEATLSMRRVPPGLDVLDETAIPAEFFKPQLPKLDRTALKDALAKGLHIDGARLDNGSISLTVRKA